ncbi:MAG: PQQ-binding-like beta-propeller repeat protein [Bacteroidales bacterium]
MNRLYPKILTAILPVALILLFIWWRSSSGNILVEPRVPGLDNRPDSTAEALDVTIGEFFGLLATEEVSSGYDWPNFRGADYDNIVKDPTPLADSWPEAGPPIIWQHLLGEGHAGAAIKNGRVYVLDYDEKERADVLRCFSLKTGRELWKRWYHVPIKRNHGMSRTIPAVTDNYLVTVGPRSHVMCVNPETGDLLWTLDMEKEYETESPFWYTGQCPLIYNDVAIFAPAGNALLIGVDCATGEVIWETPNTDNIKMSHASVMPFNILGKEMFVYFGIGGVAGVSASGDDTGKLLWTSTEWSPSVVAPTPVQIADNQILLTAGYGNGGGRLTISRQGDNYTATLTSRHNPREGISSEQQTPIVTGNFVWTILPKDAAILRNQLACYHVSDINNPVWISDREMRFGLGPYIIADNKMYLLNDDGELFMFSFNVNSVSLLARHQVIPDGIDAWGPMAIADGYLIMRDSHNLICLDIR